MSELLRTVELERKEPKRDYFELLSSHPRYEFLYTQGELARPDIVQRARETHGICYTDPRFGYFSRDAVLEDGTLDSALDGTREAPDRAFSVNYLLAVPRGKSVSEGVGSLRIIDGRHGCVDALPTYKYFNTDATALVRHRIQHVVHRYGEQNVREIAAMSTIASARVSYELMRALVQNAMIKKQETGVQEVFLTALTDISSAPLFDFAGSDTAAQQLGEPVAIYTDDPRARRDLFVAPVLLDPCEAVESIMRKLSGEPDEESRAVLMRRLEFFHAGLPDAYISDEVRTLLPVGAPIE